VHVARPSNHLADVFRFAEVNYVADISYTGLTWEVG